MWKISLLINYQPEVSCKLLQPLDYHLILFSKSRVIRGPTRIKITHYYIVFPIGLHPIKGWLPKRRARTIQNLVILCLQAILLRGIALRLLYLLLTPEEALGMLLPWFRWASHQRLPLLTNCQRLNNLLIVLLHRPRKLPAFLLLWLWSHQVETVQLASYRARVKENALTAFVNVKQVKKAMNANSATPK